MDYKDPMRITMRIHVCESHSRSGNVYLLVLAAACSLVLITVFSYCDQSDHVDPQAEL